LLRVVQFLLFHTVLRPPKHLNPNHPTKAPWSCANGAAFNLSNPLLPQRPLGWTSADAAGLPIYPGLVKVEEVRAGAINHAIRFTSRRIRDAYTYPASHLVTGREFFSPTPGLPCSSYLTS
jgi:hypothetical protein